MAEKTPLAENLMRKISVGKVTLNIGAGKSQDKLEKGLKLLEIMSGAKPVKTVTNKRIAAWGLRPGLPIGCMVTLRGNSAKELLKRMLSAKDNKLGEKQFDDFGNVSFGVPEYIDVPGVDYKPEIGILGFQVCVTLVRPGFRIKTRKLRKGKMHHSHLIKRQDAIDFMRSEFKVKIGEEE